MEAAFIKPPKKGRFLLKLALRLVERKMGAELPGNRVLLHYPKAAIGSALLELFVAHKDREVSARLLKLIRIYVSMSISCPFCLDLNGANFREKGISEKEIAALAGKISFEEAGTFTEAEIAALEYVKGICSSPISFSKETIEKLKSFFSERAIVIIASTAGQVNFWGRTLQAFGTPPAGFSDNDPVLELSKYKTLKS